MTGIAVRALILALATPPAPAPPPPPPAAPTIVARPAPAHRRTGLFGVGLGLDILQAGPMQVIASGGTSMGAVVGIGVEVDLGAHTALRVPLEIGYAGSRSTGSDGVERSSVFLEAGLAPSVVYRFRDERGQRWVPYVGAGVRLGGFMFGRRLLGLAPNPPPATEQEFVRLGAAPELTVGLLFTPVRWFSLRLAAEDTYVFVAHTSVHALSETIAPRFSF
jgi:hypothetical protein